MDGILSNQKLVNRALMGAAALAIAGAFAYAVMRSPVPVDTAVVTRGNLVVTVDEEGKTRIRDVFVVSAPASGRILRSSLEEGDAVESGKTIVAAIEPSPPPFLDLRSRRELAAQVEAARASVELAKAEVKQAEAELSFAKHDLARAQQLSRKQVVSARALEKAGIDVETRIAAVAKARANQVLRERELESAQARLTGTEESVVSGPGGSCCISLRAPVDGRVLKIYKESEQVVPQGTPLIEIGDPEKLEIVVELLSADAIRVPLGARAVVTSWGGRRELEARVKRIEPAGFTKVSSLGIEEQRVRVIFDFAPGAIGEATQRLGHDYRVFVRIVVQEIADRVLVPVGALFRSGSDWAAYLAEDGVATLRTVVVGDRN